MALLLGMQWVFLLNLLVGHMMNQKNSDKETTEELTMVLSQWQTCVEMANAVNEKMQGAG